MRQERRGVISDAIDLLFSPGGKPERALRRRIRQSGERAALKADRTIHSDAYTIRCTARDFAHRQTFRPGDVDELGDVIRCLGFLAMAASILERREPGDEG
jgi:hypothetical protein